MFAKNTRDAIDPNRQGPDMPARRCRSPRSQIVVADKRILMLFWDRLFVTLTRPETIHCCA
jgi:hypothetical protein